MVDKKTPVKKETKNKVIIKNSNEKKESKSESFVRIAEPRVKSVLRALRILGNCSNRNNYEYTNEQVENMYASISEGLDNMISKFTPSKSEQESFKF